MLTNIFGTRLQFYIRLDGPFSRDSRKAPVIKRPANKLGREVYTYLCVGLMQWLVKIPFV